MKKEHTYRLFFLLIFIFGLTMLSGSDPDAKPCRNEKFETAEPGTCLDPKAYRLLRALDRVEQNPYNNDFARRLIDMFEPRMHRVVDAAVSHEEANVPIRIYYPTRQSLENPTHIIYYIHGGGFMFGSIEEYDMAVKKLARITEKIVVSVDYRLAPDHPFPAALNDISAVLDWIIANMTNIGGNGSKVTLMGDSAGANLATVLALKARDEGKDQILSQVLYYPPTNFLETEYPSRLYFLRDERRTYLLTEEFLRRSRSSYLPDDIQPENPYVSPLMADLEGNLPPTLIITAQVDPLRDEARIYASRLSEAGQEVTYVEYPGVIHGFFNLYMIFDEGKESMQLARDFILNELKSLV